MRRRPGGSELMENWNFQGVSEVRSGGNRMTVPKDDNAVFGDDEDEDAGEEEEDKRAGDGD